MIVASLVGAVLLDDVHHLVERRAGADSAQTERCSERARIEAGVALAHFGGVEVEHLLRVGSVEPYWVLAGVGPLVEPTECGPDLLAGVVADRPRELGLVGDADVLGDHVERLVALIDTLDGVAVERDHARVLAVARHVEGDTGLALGEDHALECFEVAELGAGVDGDVGALANTLKLAPRGGEDALGGGGHAFGAEVVQDDDFVDVLHLAGGAGCLNDCELGRHVSRTIYEADLANGTAHDPSAASLVVVDDTRPGDSDGVARIDASVHKLDCPRLDNQGFDILTLRCVIEPDSLARRGDGRAMHRTDVGVAVEPVRHRLTSKIGVYDLFIDVDVVIGHETKDVARISIRHDFCDWHPPVGDAVLVHCSCR